jgi:tRNA (mo5U34)-methyltransferase
MTKEEFQLEIQKRIWFHCFDTENYGFSTPGIDPSRKKMNALYLRDLKDKTVLDIGAMDGFFSFEAERLGASLVLATDSYGWQFGHKENLLMVKKFLSSDIHIRNIRVENIEEVGAWDVVLFLGVLYHAQSMLGYLRNAYSVCRDVLILETWLDCLNIEKPVAAYYESDLQNRDPTNWWGPNILCVEAMLRDVGFRHTEFKGMWTQNVTCSGNAKGENNGRAVWHCWV